MLAVGASDEHVVLLTDGEYPGYDGDEYPGGDGYPGARLGNLLGFR